MPNLRFGKRFYTLDGHPLSNTYLLTLDMLEALQSLWAAIDRLLYPIAAWLFQLRHISYHVTLRTEQGYANSERLSQDMKRLLSGAQEVRIAVGEMGHALMEYSPLVPYLGKAYWDNRATITIVHGPRVDPQTQRVYRLAEAGIVNLYLMDDYQQQHYLLFTNQRKSVSAIVEAIHDETLWALDGNHEVTTIFAGKIRRYYVTEGTDRYLSILEREFERRLLAGHQAPSHPGLAKCQDYSLTRLVVSSLFGVPTKRLIQGLAVLFNWPIDFHRTPSQNESTRIFDDRVMQTPENGEHYKPIDLTLGIELKDIKPAPLCIVCGQQTAARFFTYEFGRKHRFRVALFPGYMCESKDCADFPPKYLSSEGLIEAYRQAREFENAEGDQNESAQYGQYMEFELGNSRTA